jgi:hypothetical protein
MHPKSPTASTTDDMFRNRLSNILDQRHALLRLAGLIEWSRFEQEYGALYAEQGRISSRRSRMRCCCAARATSTRSMPIAALSTRSSGGFALVEHGWRVLFTRTTNLVQRLQIARRELSLEAAIAKLDKYHLLILDDLAYVTKDQAETSVHFELIGARYERRSLLVTANQPFGEWGKIFPDQAMTLAVVDRLVHHATIFEMNVESYRRRTALERKRGPGRPPARATIAANA